VAPDLPQQTHCLPVFVCFLQLHLRDRDERERERVAASSIESSERETHTLDHLEGGWIVLGKGICSMQGAFEGGKSKVLLSQKQKIVLPAACSRLLVAGLADILRCASEVATTPAGRVSGRVLGTGRVEQRSSGGCLAHGVTRPPRCPRGYIAWLPELQ
jgi:hypothetical protein